MRSNAAEGRLAKGLQVGDYIQYSVRVMSRYNEKLGRVVRVTSSGLLRIVRPDGQEVSLDARQSTTARKVTEEAYNRATERLQRNA